MDVVVKRLMQRVRKLNVKIKYLLLDRVFFSVKVIRYLKNSRTPFLMPVVIRGRKKKNSKAKETNLRQFKEMLQWIEQVAEQILHDGKPYTVDTS